MLKEGDERGALEQWRAAERSGGDPGPAALQARGALRARRGEIDEAIEDYRRAVRSDPFSASLSAALALLYHRRGLGDQAEAEIRRALSVDSRAAAPRLALARIRSARGDEAGAESSLRQGLALSPGNPDLHLALAALLASSGRADEALAECGAAIAAGLDPAALWREPALRILGVRPEFRRLSGGAAEPVGGRQ
jgi:Flp pilus assembly protein TadD